MEDLDSPHGTVVNHQLVTTTELHDGDRLRIGPVRFLVAILSGAVRIAAPPKVKGEDLPPMPVGSFGVMDSAPDSPATQIARALLDQMTHKKVHGKDFVHLRVGESEGITLVELVAKGKAFVEEQEIARLESELSTLIVDGHERLVVNLKNIDRLSGAAITALMEAHRLAMSRGGRLKLCKARPLVNEMLHAVGAHKRLDVFVDEWNAVASDWPEQSAIELDDSSAVVRPKVYEPPAKRKPAKPEVEPRPVAPSQPRLSPAPEPRNPIGVPLVGKPDPADTESPTIVRLKVLVGKSQGKEIQINQPRFVIGRDPKCQLRPSSEAISRLHTRIDQRDGKVFVRDLGAANGTQVNDLQLHAKEIEVFDGDRLEVGPLVFEFSIKPRSPCANRRSRRHGCELGPRGRGRRRERHDRVLPTGLSRGSAGERPELIRPPKDGGEYGLADSD